jgi:hypothetical protein
MFRRELLSPNTTSVGVLITASRAVRPASAIAVHGLSVRRVL